MSLEGVVGAAAQSAGSPNVQDLDETGSQEAENNGYFVKEFFWDKIVIFLTSAIIGLTILDILTELLRGGNGVVCFIQDELNFSENQANYVASFCSRSVPDAQYLPIFVLIHGVLIAAWHYIWKSSFSTHFDYFFSLTNHLTRFKDEVTGDYPLKNLQIINRLETEFCTYRKSKILRWYQVKLVCQCITAIVSILVSFLLFNDFNVDFNCNWRNPSDSEVIEIPCIFASLRLFSWVRVFDTILLGLIIIVVLLAFVWTLLRHAAELGFKKEAIFSFSGGIGPEYYLPKPLLSKQGLLQLFSPRIKTDFDFLIMALYKTDSGLAHIFKEGQVHQEKKRFVEAEIRYLTSYRLIDEAAGEMEKRMAPNWIIPRDGAKTSFKTVEITKPLQIPGDIAGAVMGFGLRAPNNSYALDVSFGSLGFSLALARVFIFVGSINFDPDYKNEEEPVVAHSYPTNLTGFRCHTDVFSMTADRAGMFNKKTDEAIFKEGNRIGYMVIGPVESKEHLSTLVKLIDRFDSYFVAGAILLTVVPKQIEGKKTKFLSFKPSTKLFKPVTHSAKTVSNRLRWPPQDTTDGSPTNNLSLKCGQTSCIFELTLYKFDPDPEESDDDVSSESSSEEDQHGSSSDGEETETAATVKKPEKRGSDIVPLLQKSDKESSGAAKTESPHLLKKQPNVAGQTAVKIEMETIED